MSNAFAWARSSTCPQVVPAAQWKFSLKGLGSSFMENAALIKVTALPVRVDPARCERLESPFDLHVEPKYENKDEEANH